MSLAASALGHYHLLHQIGSGGTGTVYLAHDEQTPRQVALKAICIDNGPQESSAVVQRIEKLFVDEIQAITQLKHTSIVPIWEFSQEKIASTSYICLAMPYYAAGSLEDWLRQERDNARFPLAEIARFLSQVASALQYAHEHGVIHQDIKLSNFLLRQPCSQSGVLPDLVLTDFALARLFAATSAQGLSQSDYVRTTFMSLAPEQWDGKAVPASDQYALATVVFRLLTGQFPFQGSLGQVISQHHKTPPPAPSSLNPSLDPSVDAIIQRALAKAPTDRFSSMLDFAQAFAAFQQCSDERQSAQPPTIPAFPQNEIPLIVPAFPQNEVPLIVPQDASTLLATILPEHKPVKSSVLLHENQPGLASRNLPMLLPPLPPMGRKRLPRLWISLLSIFAIAVIIACGSFVFQAKKQATPMAQAARVPDLVATSTSVSTQAPTPGATQAPAFAPTQAPTPGATQSPVFAPTQAPTRGATPKPTPTSASTPKPTPTSAPVHQEIVDNLNDWSKVYSYTSGLSHDQNNSQWMNGDTSLIYRLSSTNQEVVWKLTGMKSFQAIAYFWPPQANYYLSDLGIYTSADNVHWTLMKPQVNGGNGNWVIYTYTLSNLSQVNFVKIRWLTTRTQSWTPQIGQVTLNS